MADKDWPRGRGEASYLTNLKITTHHLDPDYEILKQDLIRGDTRHLKVFSLISKTPGKPSFHARVDDGSPNKPKEPELDIDIDGVSKAVASDFKANRNGYLGHHSMRSPNPDERIFDIEIAIPDQRVFKGEVFFNVAFSMSSSMTLESKATVEMEVIRATPKPQTSE